MPSNNPNPVRCKAKSKQTGLPCKQYAVRGRTVCKYHGGFTPVGLASPHLKDGRYSKYLPARMAENYRTALNDPDLLVMREEVALIDSRLADLLKRVDSGESGRLWLRLQETWATFMKARAANDADGMALALTEHGDILTRGAYDANAWREIGLTIEQRRKVVESERKRLVDLQQMITTEKAMALFTAIASSIREHVKDRNALSAISADLSRLLHTGDPRQD